jgi:hypothetical protein
MENQEPQISNQDEPYEENETHIAEGEDDEELEQRLRRRQSVPKLPDPSPVDTSFSLESILEAAKSGVVTDTSGCVDRLRSFSFLHF